MARGRKRTIAGWWLIAVGLALAALLVTSRWIALHIVLGGPWGLWCFRGQMVVADWDRNDPYAATLDDPSLVWWFDGESQVSSSAGIVRWTDHHGYASPDSDTELCLLFWPLSALTTAAGAALVVPLHVGRARAARAGLCPTCRYDRSGLGPDQPCPECEQAPSTLP